MACAWLNRETRSGRSGDRGARCGSSEVDLGVQHQRRMAVGRASGSHVQRVRIHRTAQVARNDDFLLSAGFWRWLGRLIAKCGIAVVARLT